VNADKIYDGLVAFQVICVKYTVQSEVFRLVLFLSSQATDWIMNFKKLVDMRFSRSGPR